MILKDGKPDKSYSQVHCGNKRGYIRANQLNEPNWYGHNAWDFDNLEEFKWPWKTWVDHYNEYRDLCRTHDENHDPEQEINCRIISCEVTDKGIVIEWGWDERRKDVLAVLECEPFVRSYRMVFDDIKKNLEDFSEIG